MIRTLSSREKRLATIVGLVVAVSATYMLFDSYLASRASFKAQIISEEKQVRSMHELLGQSALWETRDQWLDRSQPKLENRDTAGVQLLDHIQVLAKRHEVLLENQTIHAPDPRPNCISVALDVETKSGWSSLVEFLQELQTPDQFIALESANLKIDPADATQVRGRFKIARWYAPN